MIVQINKNQNASQFYDALLEFIKKVDLYFEPPLSSRVSLEAFTHKLLEEAYVDTIIENNEILAASAYYCTPLKFDYAFLSLVASLKRGSGRILVEHMIKNCKTLGAKGIETQTWETNDKSLQLFQRFNFEKVSYVDNMNSSVKSILLKLRF